jgi:chemotaxis protein methyltransferase CheR
MEPQVFRKLCQIAYDSAGISLREGKESLVSARINKRIRALGLASEKDYLEYLEGDESGEELIHFLDVISTNFTHFYRESEHFEILSRHLATLAETGQSRFRIWCAASSTGEEPYTIAITAAETLALENTDLRILATDISTRVLARAAHGVYEARALKDVPASAKLRYFSTDGRHNDETALYTVTDTLKQLLVFRRLNLATPPFPMKGGFDAIFVRNVMIYFDHATRARLIAECLRLLAPKGLLFVGHSESLSGIDAGLQKVASSVFSRARKPLIASESA